MLPLFNISGKNQESLKTLRHLLTPICDEVTDKMSLKAIKKLETGLATLDKSPSETLSQEAIEQLNEKIESHKQEKTEIEQEVVSKQRSKKKAPAKRAPAKKTAASRKRKVVEESDSESEEESENSFSADSDDSGKEEEKVKETKKPEPKTAPKPRGNRNN